MRATGFWSIVWLLAAIVSYIFDLSDAALYSALAISAVWAAADRVIDSVERRP